MLLLLPPLPPAFPLWRVDEALLASPGWTGEEEPESEGTWFEEMPEVMLLEPCALLPSKRSYRAERLLGAS